MKRASAVWQVTIMPACMALWPAFRWTLAENIAQCVHAESNNAYTCLRAWQQTVTAQWSCRRSPSVTQTQEHAHFRGMECLAPGVPSSTSRRRCGHGGADGGGGVEVGTADIAAVVVGGPRGAGCRRRRTLLARAVPAAVARIPGLWHGHTAGGCRSLPPC